MKKENRELEELVETYLAGRTPDNLNRLVNHIRNCQVLVPANVDENRNPQPCLMAHKENGVFLPVYTCQEQIPREPRSAGVLRLPFLSANKLVAKQPQKIEGIVINPFSHNLIFKKALIERIEEVERDRAKAGAPKKVRMTQEQYRIFERNRFAFGNFPKTFFSHYEEVIEGLCDKREAYVDQIFETGYQQQRIYPYLPEDFSVMVMNITNELCIIRVDLPEKDIGLPACRRVYLSWNEQVKRGRYLTVEITEDADRDLLGEVTADGKHVEHGEAPAEGAQLQRIIDLILEQNVRRRDT